MTKILTYLTYEDLFGEILYIPNTPKENIIDSMIRDFCTDLNVKEAIRHCSFLNMIYQTQDFIDHQNKELRSLNIKPKKNHKGVLFHRENLLYLISLLIKENNNLHDRELDNTLDRAKLYKILSLINSELNITKENLIVSRLVRDHPYSYSSKTTQDYYLRWIIRYWDIYSKRIHELPYEQKNIITIAIKNQEIKTRAALSKKFMLVRNLFLWFSLTKEYMGKNYKNCFDKENDRTFCIKSKNFSTTTLEIIKGMACQIEDFHRLFIAAAEKDQSKGRMLDKYYQDILKFFEYPFLKIDEENFCLLDLKFLIESTCFSLRYEDIKVVSPPYGEMLEKYFHSLLPKIFSTSKNLGGNNEPDAILETDNYIIIFEFTTEYYSIWSLHNSNLSNFKKCLEKILFNPGKKESNISGKKDPGKFIKLNRYVEKYQNGSNHKIIIPVLVTEKNLGDYYLLNEIDGFLTQGIKKNKLSHLEKQRPLIISLDDLEIYWSLMHNNNPSKAAKDFIKSIFEWEKSQEKGRFFYVFSFFLEKKYGHRQLNQEYDKFFSIDTLTDEFKQ